MDFRLAASTAIVAWMEQNGIDAYVPVLAGDMKNPSLDLPAAPMPLRRLSPFLSLRRSALVGYGPP
jgi:hypothetical protein